MLRSNYLSGYNAGQQNYASAPPPQGGGVGYGQNAGQNQYNSGRFTKLKSYKFLKIILIE